MQVFPPNAASKLGFGIIFDRVRYHLRSGRGREALAKERPSSDAAEVAGRLAEVADLQQILRFDDPLPWGELPDIQSLLKTVRPVESIPEPFDLLDLHQVILAAEKLRKYLAPRKGKYPSLQPLCEAIPDLAALGANIGSSVGPDGEIMDSASEDLRRVRSSIAARERDLRNVLQKELRSAISAGFATEDQPTIRNGRMVIPVRAEAKRKVRGFVQDASATGQTVFIEPEACLELNNDVRELQAEERREVRRVLASLGDQVRSLLDDLITTTNLLAHFDIVQAKSRVANELDGIVPALEGKGRLKIRGGRNPALALRLGVLDSEDDDHERKVVPLDFELTSDRRTVLITGPNAGGKTVALGTIGLFTLMIAHGIPIPADEGTEIPIFKKLFIDIGDEQSIEDDLSTFSSHIRNLREMLKGADRETLVLIDEAGTGTDPEEGAALAQAAFEALGVAGAWTVATTHHGRLKAFAHNAGFARNAAMEFNLDTLEPTYRLQMDLPGSSYAFEIGRRLELPDSMLDRARELLGAPARSLEDLIVDYQTRVRDLEHQQEEVRSRLEAAEGVRADYEAKRRELEQGRSRRRAEMLEEGQDILRKANAIVERTIREIKESQADREATRIARAQLEAFKQDVDEALASEQAGAEVGKPSSQPSSEATQIKPGDQVILDDGHVTAEVIEFDGDEVVISSGALRMRVAPSRLRKVGGKREQQVLVRQQAASGSATPSLGVSQRIDVRGQRVDEGLQSVRRFIDEALPTSLKRLEILHGKGTGALRKAIHDYLEERADVASFEEADWEQGGAGVTIVRLG